MENYITDLIGKILTKIDNAGDEIIFTCDDGTRFKMYHSQDCCESVRVEDIAGDLDNLIGAPITMAREDTSEKNPAEITKEYQDDSFTWTFYNLGTRKGYVTIRWYGESNGYYSERVDFVKL